MVDYPQDSVQLMKKIMDVQEELDRFRVTSFYLLTASRVAALPAVPPSKSPEVITKKSVHPQSHPSLPITSIVHTKKTTSSISSSITTPTSEMKTFTFLPPKPKPLSLALPPNQKVIPTTQRTATTMVSSPRDPQLSPTNKRWSS
jgi:hypothetical protein